MVRSGLRVVASGRSVELDLTHSPKCVASGVASLTGMAQLLDLGPGHCVWVGTTKKIDALRWSTARTNRQQKMEWTLSHFASTCVCERKGMDRPDRLVLKSADKSVEVDLF